MRYESKSRKFTAEVKGTGLVLLVEIRAAGRAQNQDAIQSKFPTRESQKQRSDNIFPHWKGNSSGRAGQI